MEQQSDKENSKRKKAKNKGKVKNKLDTPAKDVVAAVSATRATAEGKDAPDKPVNRPKKEIVDLFWLLSNEDAKVRQASISKLSSFSSAEETAYILKRLVGGLASDRPLVRPTFSAALATFLNNSGSGVDGEALVASTLEKAGELEVCGMPREKRSAALGRILAYAAVLRSNLVSKDSRDLQAILKDVVELGRIDRVLSKAASKLLLSLLDSFSTASSFKEVFWPTLLPVFKPLIGDEGCDVEALTLLLRCAIKYPIAIKKRTKADLGFKLDLTSISWSSGAVSATLEKAVAELTQREHADQAKALLAAFVTMSNSVAGSFERFWVDFVCGRLCPSKDKNVSLLRILDVVFQQPPTTEILKAALPRRGLDALSKCHQLPSKNPGRQAAEGIVEKLVSFVADETFEADKKMTILQTIVKQETGTDASGGGRLASAVNRLLSAAPDELLQKIWLLLRDELLLESRKKANGDHDKKRFLWVIKQVQSCLQKRSSTKASDWEIESLQLLFLLAHFHIPSKEAEVPSPSVAKVAKSCPDWLVKAWLSSTSVSTPVLLTNERQRIGEFIFDAVLKIALAKDSRVDALLRFGQFVDALLSSSPSLLEPQLSSTEVASAWREISAIIASVEKQKSLLPEGQESPVLDVFQKLFLVMGFQVFTDLESVIESLPDLKVCASKGCGLNVIIDNIVDGGGGAEGGEKEEEPNWIDVLTEVLVSFLLKENQNYRKFVVSAIPLLLPHFTQKSFQIVKDSVVGKFAGESVITVEEEEEEEEEEREEEEKEEEGEDKEEDEQDMDEGEKEDDDDDGGDDDEDDGDENEPLDSTEDELQALKTKLASAMGAARPKHLEMDPETDNEESDVDDDEMFKFDDKIAGVFKELESKKKASVEKKATAKKQKQIEESKMRFRFRCLDLLSTLFLHVPDADNFLLLFDALVDLEASTRCKAGSALSSKAAFDDRVRHLVREVGQFKRGVPKSATSTTTSAAALGKLRDLLKDNLKHASPRSEVPSLCNILVKIFLATSEGTASADMGKIDVSTAAESRSLVNSAFLDNLDAVLASSKSGDDGKDGGGCKSSVSNVKFEHFSPFESFLNRFQTEVVDDATLSKVEELAYRRDLSSFCRKRLVGILNHALALFCRKESAREDGKVKRVFARNLNACLECAVAEVGKKETTGFDASSIVSHLSIILQMHKSKGKIVSEVLEDRHRDSLRQLAAALTSSSASSAAHKLLLDGIGRVAMYWGLTKEIRRMGANKKEKRKRKVDGGGGSGVVVVDDKEAKTADAMQTDEVTTEESDDMKGKLALPTGGDANTSEAGGGKKRKRQKMESAGDDESAK